MTHPHALSWNPDNTAPELHSLLDTLGGAYPFHRHGEGQKMVFAKAGQPGTLKVESAGETTQISYGSPAAAARGLGHALARQSVQYRTPFSTQGMMLDCSRHAVMKVSYLKNWMRQLALMGYNLVMLYTEDTYVLPDEPYFGYMRGGYTGAEIEEIDAYAQRLGIEVVACIQTLGHMEQILKWPHYRDLQDTERVLLAGDPKTHQLIEKMLAFWSRHLQTRRIHIGMDEAYEFGRGRYLDKHGREPLSESFNRHLAKVKSLCEAEGLKPMIWGDMYFTMSDPSQKWYDSEASVPKEVKDLIPKEVELVYWQYEDSDPEVYRSMIAKHRDLGKEPIMAGGIWTWGRFWYDYTKTEPAVSAAVQACREEGVSEIFFTLWGNGTSYCEFDSALAGLAYAADRCYGGEGKEKDLTPFVLAVCGADYSAMRLGSALQVESEPGEPPVSASTILWDDPLLGIGWQGLRQGDSKFWPGIAEKLRALKDRVAPHVDGPGVPDYAYLQLLCEVMIRKIEFREDLVKAYQARDQAALLKLKDEAIPPLLQAVENLAIAFRRQWLRRNKVLGMEATQIRLGAALTRYRETALRIEELCDGRITEIEELESRSEGLGRNPVEYFVWLSTGGLTI